MVGPGYPTTPSVWGGSISGSPSFQDTIAWSSSSGDTIILIPMMIDVVILILTLAQSLVRVQGGKVREGAKGLLLDDEQSNETSTDNFSSSSTQVAQTIESSSSPDVTPSLRFF